MCVLHTFTFLFWTEEEKRGLGCQEARIHNAKSWPRVDSLILPDLVWFLGITASPLQSVGSLRALTLALYRTPRRLVRLLALPLSPFLEYFSLLLFANHLPENCHSIPAATGPLPNTPFLFPFNFPLLSHQIPPRMNTSPAPLHLFSLPINSSSKF